MGVFQGKMEKSRSRFYLQQIQIGPGILWVIDLANAEGACLPRFVLAGLFLAAIPGSPPDLGLFDHVGSHAQPMASCHTLTPSTCLRSLPRRAALRGSKCPLATVMSLDQLRAFLLRMQDDDALRQQVLAAATADDVAQIALRLGYEFSGDELLRASGQRFERVTVRKNDIPGEYT